MYSSSDYRYRLRLRVFIGAVIDVPREALVYQAELTREARLEWGMDAPIAALAGQLMQESGFDPKAKSAYASGLSQFTPATARWISTLSTRLSDPNPLDPSWSIRAMVFYDHLLHDGVNPANDECGRYRAMLAEYNGGAKRWADRQKLSKEPGNYDVTAVINPGISKSNQQQNQNYAFFVVYRWQAIFVSWSGPLVCLPKTGN